MEVLAPGGSIESIESAIHHGADAIYLGVGALNARVRAGNLTPSQLAGVIAFAHAHGTRVHVALNVPLRLPTVDEAARTLAAACVHGADAIILRDPALMAAVRDLLPDLPIHASTQAGVASVESARRARDLGCRRVILARELSREAIERIALELPGLELEAFVFGAQCFGVSGSCLFGEALGGRSGNYGSCSQPCRLPWFDASGRPLGHVFSTKDLDLFPRLAALRSAGVTSLKIEGRLKPPAWVGCVTSWLRRAVDRDPPGLSPDEAAAFDRDVSVLFARDRSSSFFDGQTDAADVLRTDFPGQRGLDVGAFQVAGPGRVRFDTPVDLNIRDGLMLRFDGPDGPVFEAVSIRDLRDGRGAPCMRISAGRAVDCDVPRTAGLVAVAIHSADSVRARWEVVNEHVPACVAEDRPPWPQFDRVTVGADRIAVTMSRGRVTVDADLPLATEPSRNAGLDDARARRLFPDATFDITPSLFVNPTALKEARRAFVEQFDSACNERADTIAEAIVGHLTENGFQPAQADADLLATGRPLAVSRVTGMREGTVVSSAGDRVEVKSTPRGTALRYLGKGDSPV